MKPTPGLRPALVKTAFFTLNWPLQASNRVQISPDCGRKQDFQRRLKHYLIFAAGAERRGANTVNISTAPTTLLPNKY